MAKTDKNVKLVFAILGSLVTTIFSRLVGDHFAHTENTVPLHEIAILKNNLASPICKISVLTEYMSDIILNCKPIKYLLIILI